MILIDSNIILDVWDRDPMWSAWSTQQLRSLAAQNDLAINTVIYAEVSARFSAQARLDEQLADLGLIVLDIPREAAFLAGKAFVQYRLQGGSKRSVLPDFFIGAHAQTLGCPLLTRDTRNYASYFHGVRLIAP
jgi:predicted nucleic acid-binding protein